MDGYDVDKIVICPHCGKLEYWGEMRWLNGTSYCRGCYKANVSRRNLFSGESLEFLDGERPTFAELRAQGGGTGKYDKFGDEIMEGDIVHFRANGHGLSGKGVVFFQESADFLGDDPFRIRDTRPGKQNGRVYPFYRDATYRIDGHVGEAEE